MSKKNYKKMAEEILALVGGKDNVATHVNCVTRLRVTPVDESKIDFDGLEKLDYVIRVQVVSGVTQIVLGPGTVNEVEAEFRHLLGTNISEEVPTDEDFKTKALNFIQQTMMPVIGVLIGGSLLVAFLNMAQVAGVSVAQDEAPFLFMLYTLGNMVTKYIGVFVAVSATRALKSNTYIPLLFALMIYVADIGGTHFGPIEITSGIGGMVGIVMMVFIIVYLEKFFRRVIPKVISFVFVPFFTILAALVAFIFIVAPIADLIVFVMMAIVNIILNGNQIVYVLGHAFMGAMWPLLVLTGTHAVVSAVLFPYLETVGYMPLMAATLLFTASIGGATIASIFKYRKDRVLVDAAVSSSITAFLGVTEPAIYGVLLPKGRNFIMVLISGAIGGFFVGLLNINVGFGVPGILIIFGVLDHATMFIPYTIIYFGTAILAGALVMLFGQKE